MSKKQKKRTIVIGDIHGCYNEFVKLLKLVKYNSRKDKLILLGDYIDRGENAYKVVKKVQKLQKKNKNVIALRGNHEQMLLDAYDNGKWSNAFYTWEYNGAGYTLRSYEKNKTNVQDDLDWFKSLPYYYEDDSRIYVHAGINPKKPIDKQDLDTLIWTREPFLFSKEEFNKEVIFGHTPSLMMTEDTKPYRTDAGNLGIDTGCVYGGKLTALIFKEGQELKFIQVAKEETAEKSI